MRDMKDIVEWFSLNYPNLVKQMQECSHHFSFEALNPYHLEGDCWSHTMMVCNVAKIKGFSLEVKWAALLHDIGKPVVRKVNAKNNHVQFFEHEKLSAKLAEPILDKLISEKKLSEKDKKTILKLILKHGDLYKFKGGDEFIEAFKDDYDFLKKLLELIICDDLGRFTKQKATINPQELLKKIETPQMSIKDFLIYKN